MKRGLLVPTGNIECDLISFAANTQHSATSPVFSRSQGKDLSPGYGSNTRSAHPRRHRRPLTEHSVCRKPRYEERQSGVRSAHVPRMVEGSEAKSEENASYHDEEKPRLKTTILVSGQRRSRTKRESKVEARSNPVAGHGFSVFTSPSQRADMVRIKPKEPEEEHSDNLQRSFGFEQEKRVSGFVERSRTRSPHQKKSKVSRFETKKSIQKSKKRTKRNKSVLPLPTGTSFDNLVRSGDLAKHVAKRERNLSRFVS